MPAMNADAMRAHSVRPNGLHWAKRPLPEPPRTRRVSKWTRLPLDGIQEKLEEWLHEQSVNCTYDGD
jgi:hypothetical protein